MYRSLRSINHANSRGRLIMLLVFWPKGGRRNSIMVSVPFVKQAIQVRAQHDPFVSERWNSISMLSTSPHQGRQLVHQRPSVCYVYVIMLFIVREGQCVPLAGFCLSLYNNLQCWTGTLIWFKQSHKLILSNHLINHIHNVSVILNLIAEEFLSLYHVSWYWVWIEKLKG